MLRQKPPVDQLDISSAVLDRLQRSLSLEHSRHSNTPVIRSKAPVRNLVSGVSASMKLKNTDDLARVIIAVCMGAMRRYAVPSRCDDICCVTLGFLARPSDGYFYLPWLQCE